MTKQSADPRTDLQAVFLAGVEGHEDGATLPEDLGATLHVLYEEARAAWPGVALDAPRFVTHLAERVSAGPGLAAALAELRAPDLYLACACQHGVGAAITRFDAVFAAPIAAFVHHVDGSPALVDEVRQILRQKLFVSATEGVPPKIAGYQGRGPLASWVGVAAQRAALDLRRGPAAKEQPIDDALSDGLPAGVDPELDYLKMRYRAEFREAFRAAFAALPPRERIVLRLHMVKRLSHESIGAIYHVNQSTVSRWIGHAREAIATEARRYLHARLDVSTEEFNSLGNLVASQLDLSITRWLGDD